MIENEIIESNDSIWMGRDQSDQIEIVPMRDKIFIRLLIFNFFFEIPEKQMNL